MNGGIVITDVSGSNYDYAYGMEIDNNNNIYIIGELEGISFYYIVLIKYNSSGFKDTNFGPNNNGIVITDINNDYPNISNIVLDNQNNIYICGYSDPDTGSNTDFLLVKYNSNGDLDTNFGPNNNGIVITDISGNNYDQSFDMKIDTQNNIYLAGHSNGQDYHNNNDIVLVKYNSNGDLDTNFGPNNNGIVITDISGNKNDYCRSISIDDSNNIYLAGYSQNQDSNNHSDIVLVKYDSNGDLDTNFGPNNNGIVITDISDNKNDYAYGMEIDNNNNIYLSGHSKYQDSNNKDDIILVKYDSNGDLDTNFGPNNNGIVITDISGNKHDYCRSILIDDSNNIYLAGFSQNQDSNNNSDIVLVKYDSSGNLNNTFGPNNNGIVITDISGNKNDYAYGISIDTQNNIYLSGYSDGQDSNNNNDIVLVKYNPDGNLDTNFGIINEDNNNNNKTWRWLFNNMTGCRYKIKC